MAKYRGSYHIRIDYRRRVTVPIRLLQTLKDRSDTPELAAVLADTGDPPHITFYDQPALNDIEQEVSKLPHGSADRLALESHIFSDAQLLKIDKSGRVILPANLLAPIGLGPNANAVFLAAGESFNLHNPEHLAKFKAEYSKSVRP